MYIQAIPETEGFKYRWNIFDVTKVVPHGDYPLIPVGTLVLNKNVTNYFQETEQSAFSPSNLVPGMSPSIDKMLQGRLFSYPDTHRHSWEEIMNKFQSTVHTELKFTTDTEMES